MFNISGVRTTHPPQSAETSERLQPNDLDALSQLFERIETDHAIRGLMPTGTAFSAGYDPGSIAKLSANAQ